MQSKTVLGYIDCPTCGAAKGMRVTPDKNGDPFGFCQAECGQQLRVGGNRERVNQFIARYPWAGQQAAPAAPEKPVTVTEEKPAAAPVTEAKPVTAKKRTGLNDALQYLGVK
jgi:hypothetical protein